MKCHIANYSLSGILSYLVQGMSPPTSFVTIMHQTGMKVHAPNNGSLNHGQLLTLFKEEGLPLGLNIGWSNSNRLAVIAIRSEPYNSS